MNNTTIITIRENVPVPARNPHNNLNPRQKGDYGPIRAAIMKLEPGQSFSLPHKEVKKVSAAANATRRETGRKFAVRSTGSGDSKEVGIWRIS